MNRDDLRAFANRDWAAMDRLKHAVWLRQRRIAGPDWAFESGEALASWARAVRPDWPTAEDRRRDLECHVRVAENLRRVVAARSR